MDWVGGALIRLSVPPSPPLQVSLFLPTAGSAPWAIKGSPAQHWCHGGSFKGFWKAPGWGWSRMQVGAVVSDEGPSWIWGGRQWRAGGRCSRRPAAALIHRRVSP